MEEDTLEAKIADFEETLEAQPSIIPIEMDNGELIAAHYDYKERTMIASDGETGRYITQIPADFDGGVYSTLEQLKAAAEIELAQERGMSTHSHGL